MRQSGIYERPFSDVEYKRRLSAVRDSMASRGIDVLLVYAPESLNYLTGYDSIGYFDYQCLIVPLEEELALLVRRPDLPLAQDTSNVHDVRVWADSLHQNPPLDTRSVLEERGLLRGQLGVEKAPFALGAGLYELLREVFSDREVLDGSDLVLAQRYVKSDEERAYMRRAGALADLAVQAALEVARQGVSELEVAAHLEYVLRLNGSEHPAMPLICTRNPRFFGRGMPTPATIQRGDLLQIELYGCVHHYHAVLMRSIFIGEPSRRLLETRRVVSEAVAAVTEALRPGATISEVDRARLRVFAEAGLESGAAIDRTGVAIGLGYPPSYIEGLPITRDNPFVLEPGMTFLLQPGLNFVDEGVSYALANTVMVTESGHEALTRCPSDLQLE